ncbi:MAG: calcium/sodium antiporter [Myxococcales bacterium]|nr:calcium/sodium antiporter [Myxococcales bacterium]MCB9541182.1 calcium/sodium antiporter [Myxococcales bacterium]
MPSASTPDRAPRHIDGIDRPPARSPATPSRIVAPDRNPQESPLLLDIVSLLGGLVLLVIAADWLVDGAVGVARRLGIPPLVVGLTIVAYGTSLPEFVVSLLSAHRGVVEFAIGNIVGSNIANVALVLGAAALIHPIAIKGGLLFKRDLPVLAVTTALAIVFFLDGVVSRVEGVVLALITVGFTIVCLRSPEEESDGDDAPEDEGAPWPRAPLLVVIGLVGLVGGAHLMVEGGASIAATFGVDERIIGLTIVAVGTSLPELATSVAGAMKGHSGLAVGNVVGSCIFNLAFVLGATALIKPPVVDVSAMSVDLALMGGLAVVMWVMLRTGYRMSRGEGGGLLAVYAGFVAFLVWQTVTGVA